MTPLARLAWGEDPLALDPHWSCGLPLLPLQEALERTVFRAGLSRQAWLRRLADQLHAPALLPLLWLLPRGWRLTPAALPPRLQGLAATLEQGLLSPLLLAALVDDLAHLLPPSPAEASAFDRWSRTHVRFGGQERPIPATATELEARLATALEDATVPADHPDAAREADRSAGAGPLFGGLIWRNIGLRFAQGEAARRVNAELAQVLNRLAANLASAADPWSFEGCRSGRTWIAWLEARGWSIQGRLRASIASFGLGASLPDDQGGWSQVPLGLPLRTGLLDGNGEEAMTLLPHTALELQLHRGSAARVSLQYYQGSEGLCGWEGLNDLHRPWQNDPANGTVRYLGEPFTGERLLELIDLAELTALLHNRLASDLALRGGGYGPLGFCIDTTALLQQAMSDRCDLFPLLLSGIWRERLQRWSLDHAESSGLAPEASTALERYQQALARLPLDLSHHGADRPEAWRRLRACLPASSPFQQVERLQSAGLSSDAS